MIWPVVWIGFDPREADAFMVAKSTLLRNAFKPVNPRGLRLPNLIEAGLYTRPTERRVTSDGRRILWDAISQSAMSTEHANARFLVPHLSKTGWALFCDCDVMFRKDVHGLFAQRDESKAVMCVQHNHAPRNAFKMDGQVQANYSRKNWSSVMLFNCDHPANKRLTVEMVNTVPGRDLHRFCWLEDDEIGSLDQSWNYLVGHTDPEIEPDIVHFTDGTPSMPGYENVEYADEWRSALYQAAA